MLDARPEIAGRVRARVGRPGASSRGERGARSTSATSTARDLVYVCMHDRPRDELVVVTLWEEGEDRGRAAPLHRRAARPPANFGWVGVVPLEVVSAADRWLAAE